MSGTGPSQRHMRLKKLNGFAGRFREERGSALVLVMFIVLLLTILGLSVLTAAVGGAQRTETRKNDVQSLHLAEKTLDEAVAYITASLNKVVDESVDLSQQELDAKIMSFLSALQGGQNDLLASTELLQASGDKAVGRIIYVDPVSPSQSGESVSYTLNLTAQAEVNGVIRKLTQAMIIDTYPDFLKYTLGSEKNLTINGSPYIQGNIYAGDTLTISDTALYSYLADRSFVSKPFVLDGEAHVQSLNKLFYKEGSQAILKGNEVTDKGILPAASVKIKNHRSFVEVNVESSFIDKVEEAIGNGASRQHILDNINNGSLATYLSSKYGAIFDHPVLPAKPDPEDTSDEGKELQKKYNDAVNHLTNPQKSLVYDGDLILDGTELNGINYTEAAKNSPSSANSSASRNWYIVDGNLTINNYGSTIPIKVRGNILVTGTLEIRGKVQFDSTIFVLQNSQAADGEKNYTTIVEDASIEGMRSEVNGKPKELVLISQGPILINRLAAFDNTVQAPLEAFFYTDSDAMLYGVGSIFSLNGGFFAKGDLTINAVRGKATGGEQDINITGDDLIRFKATYNDKIFTDQQAGLPRVKAVNIRVGDLKLD